MSAMLVLFLHLGVVIAWLLAIAGVLAFWCPWLELCNEFRPFALIATVVLVLAAMAAPRRRRLIERLRALCGAFALIAAFSLAPQLVAYSTPATSSDIICYMDVMLAGALQLKLRPTSITRCTQIGWN